MRISRRRTRARQPCPGFLRHAAATAAFVCLVSGGLFAASPTLSAEAPINVGKFRHWMAVMLQQAGDRFCYVRGTPVRKRSRHLHRGATYVQVVQLPLPDDRHTDEVMLTAGYRYLDHSLVTLNIDGRKFRLKTQEDTAWTRDVKIDPTLIRAMKKGRRMVVRGKSSEGTRTVDTYSLVGFTDAYRAAADACGTK